MQSLNLDDTACDKIHFLTDAIYRNLLDNFTPGIRQLISSGRTYQKAMLSMTTAAKAYIDCMYGIAQSGLVCKGGTSELGNALLQLAEIYHQNNSQAIENIKLFHTELLIPLEARQDAEQKHLQVVYKKYIAGHKFNQNPYEKARSALRKQRKKAKNKFGFDQKEMQFARQLRETMGNLNDYHLHGLRQALTEERTCYCFMLDRLCSVVKNYTQLQHKSNQLFSLKYSDWKELTKFPQRLPGSSEAVLQAFQLKDEAQRSILERQKTLEEHRKQSADDTRGTPSKTKTQNQVISSPNLCHSRSMPAHAAYTTTHATQPPQQAPPHPQHSAPVGSVLQQQPPAPNAQQQQQHQQQQQSHSVQQHTLTNKDLQHQQQQQHLLHLQQQQQQHLTHHQLPSLYDNSRRPSLQDKPEMSISTPSDASCRGNTSSHRLPSARCTHVQAMYSYTGTKNKTSVGHRNSDPTGNDVIVDDPAAGVGARNSLKNRSGKGRSPEGGGGDAGGIEGEDGYQLTMLEGDRIKLSGDSNDGWQFGENTRTQQLGWFPLSFTQPVMENIVEDELKPLSQRIKSLNNLNEPLTPGYMFAAEYTSGHLNRLAYATSVAANGTNSLMRQSMYLDNSMPQQKPCNPRNSIALPSNANNSLNHNLHQPSDVDQTDSASNVADMPRSPNHKGSPYLPIQECIDPLPEPPHLQPHIERLTALNVLDYTVPPREPTSQVLHPQGSCSHQHTYENPYQSSGEFTVSRQPQRSYYPPQTPGPNYSTKSNPRPVHSPVPSSGYSSGISGPLPAPPSNLAPPPPLICTEDDELQSASVLANKGGW